MEIQFPLIILNFKTYSESSGKKGIFLAKTAEKVAHETGVSIVVAPNHSLLGLVASSIDIPVFAKSVDSMTPGSHTGWIVPENLATAGVRGVLINHSEHPVPLESIKQCISLSGSEHLMTVVCARDAATSEIIAGVNPGAVAMEPPELIGSGISVTTRPDVVRDTVRRVKAVNKTTKVIVGAGITNGRDVQESLSLNAEGVLLASGFVQSKSPEKTLLEMAKMCIK